MDLRKKVGICFVMGLDVLLVVCSTFQVTTRRTNEDVDSAFICDIIKITKLDELQDHADFTCEEVLST